MKSHGSGLSKECHQEKKRKGIRFKRENSVTVTLESLHPWSSKQEKRLAGTGKGLILLILNQSLLLSSEVRNMVTQQKGKSFNSMRKEPVRSSHVLKPQILMKPDGEPRGPSLSNSLKCGRILFNLKSSRSV